MAENRILTMVVQGMTNDASQRAVARALLQLRGVEEVLTPLDVRSDPPGAVGSLAVKYDPIVIQPGEMRAAVESLGYELASMQTL